MKVNPNYLGRLFTENELTEEERQLAEKLPAMRKEKGKLFCHIVIVLFWRNGIYPSVLTIVGSA